jgi:CcmD family protein
MRATLLLVLFVSTTPALIPGLAAGAGMTAQQPQAEPPKPTDEFVPISQLPTQDQLPAAPLLVTAYAFVWVALFGYLVSVGRRLSRVQREVDRLEADIAKGTRA